MDLFDSAPRVRDLTATPPRPDNVAYFSINNGSTNLDNWNTNPNGDLAIGPGAPELMHSLRSVPPDQFVHGSRFAGDERPWLGC